jgi:hypothetical protein
MQLSIPAGQETETRWDNVAICLSDQWHANPVIASVVKQSGAVRTRPEIGWPLCFSHTESGSLLDRLGHWRVLALAGEAPRWIVKGLRA